MIQNIQFSRSSVHASDAISEGMSFPGFNYWFFFGVGLVAWLLILIVAFVPILGIYLQPMITGPLMVGLFTVFLKKFDGESADFAMMFDGFKKFVPAMIVSFIQAAPWIILQTIQLFANFAFLFANNIGVGNFVQSETVPDFSQIFAGSVIAIFMVFFVLVIIFSIVIYITFFCAYPLLAEYDIGAIEAIKLSARAGWSNAGGLILLAILQSLVAFLGMLVCGIGVFFVLPLIYGSSVVAYRRIFPKVQKTIQDFSPPPPSEYGDMFGQNG